MGKNRSTKDFELGNKDSKISYKSIISTFKSKTSKNFYSKNVLFYTFNAGFKKKNDDLLLAIFNSPIKVAALYSKTSTPSAPIIWDKKNNKGYCKVLIVNSGNANAHTGAEGIKSIDKYVKHICKTFNCSKNEVLVSSTGVIGEQIDFKKIIKKINNINFKKNNNIVSAAKSIMTTDTYPKTFVDKIKIKSKEIKIFGFAKGSGMIAPNMGTMLAYVFVEANINKNSLKKILKENVESTFNSITVDGDTSTSDTLMLFSIPNENMKVINNKNLLTKISNKIGKLMNKLAIQIVADGEGISKLIKINVFNAKTYKQSSEVAFSIANSLLVKTAIAGADANWGRIIMAIGKTNANILQEKIKLKIGNFLVAEKGKIYSNINLKALNNYMKNHIIEINVNLNLGECRRVVYSTDLTYDYIRINADYRS